MVVEPLIGESLRGSAIEFIDYARWIVSFLIIYYAIRFFTVSDEEEDRKAEEAWKERGEKYSEVIKKKLDESKLNDAQKSRHLHTAVAQSSLIEALKAAEEALDAKSDVKLSIYKKNITKLHKDIDNTLKALRHNRSKLPTTTAAPAFNVNTAIAGLQLQRDAVNTKLLDAAVIPKTDAELRASTTIETNVKAIRDALTPILDALRTYITTP